jgi:hypothetical protein
MLMHDPYRTVGGDLYGEPSKPQPFKASFRSTIPKHKQSSQFKVPISNPRACNHGGKTLVLRGDEPVSKKSIGVTIDWLAYTLDRSCKAISAIEMSGARALAAYHATGQEGTWIEQPGLHGYMYRLVSAEREGLAVYLGDEADRQGAHAVWSGRALRGANPEDRLRFAVMATGRITRLDIAIDAHALFDFRMFFEAARAGELKTRSRKASIIDSDTGTTVYIGSRSSEKMLRVYDKAAESGEGGEWTRIELELKGSEANSTGQYLCKHGLANIPAIIRAFCDWPTSERWLEIFASIPVVSVPKEEKVTDRDKWFRDQVRPALLAEIRQGRASALELVAVAIVNMSPEHQERVLELVTELEGKVTEAPI